MGIFAPSYPFGVNAKAFGAVGDGVHDDTVALQAAINFAPAPGGLVFIPRGTYKVTASLLLQKSTRLVGEGMSTPDPVAAPAPVTIIDGSTIVNNYILRGAANGTNCEIRDLRVQGPMFYDAGVNSHGVYSGNFAQNFRLSNVYVYGCYTAFWIGNAQGVVLTGCRAETPRNCGLFLDGGAGITSVGGIYANNMGEATVPYPANVRMVNAIDVTLLDPLIDEGFGTSACVTVLGGHDITINCNHMNMTGGGYGIRLGDGVNNPTRVRIIGINIGPFAVGEDPPIQTIEIYGTGHALIGVTTDAHGGGDILDHAADTIYLAVNGLNNFTGGAPVGKQNAATPTVAELKAGLVAWGLFNP